MNRKIISASAVLAGTVIGVGLFSLPYIASKVGILLMALYFVAIGGVSLLIHLFFGEISLKAPDFKRLPGFAKIYLGPKAEKISMFSVIFGLSGAILAYLIVGGGFMSDLLSPYFGQSQLFYTLVYFIIGSALVYFGIKAIAKIEFWAIVLFIFALGAMFFKAGQQEIMHIGNLLPEFNLKDVFLPYGAVLFSFWGISVIPEMEEMLGRDKTQLKKGILAGMLASIIISFLFVFLILGITGPSTSPSALPGLKDFFKGWTIVLALLFGLAATFTSFVTLGLTLKKVFWYDLGIKEKASWLLSCFPPLVLFFLGMKNFIGVISFVGGVMIGIDGIMVMLIYQRIKKGKSRLVTYPLIFLLFSGIVYEIIYFLK